MGLKKPTTESTIPNFISKPWGYELVIANNKAYCGKKLVIAKGQMTSLHYHETKDETFFVQSGRSAVYYCDDPKQMPPPLKDGEFNPEAYLHLKEIKLNKGDTFHIPPRRVHQICALEDLELIEISTQHKEDDTIRFYTDRRS